MPESREVLEEFRALLRQPATLTARRNAVRTFHDFLKVLLNELARPEEELFLGQVDLRKRFNFLAIHFPELKQFTDLVGECKSQRDRVDHSDNQAPPVSVLECWNETAQTLLEKVERCQKRRSEEQPRQQSEKMLPRIVLVGEFEEVERLAGILSANLCTRGVPSKELEVAVHKFRSLYEPYYGWNDAKIDSATDFEIADAIQAMARQNGQFSQMLDILADILTSQFTPKRETIN